MAYCKRCQCGHVLIYENMGGAPLRCPKCSRFIAALKEEIYREPDPAEPEVPEISEPEVEIPQPVEQEPQIPEEEQTPEETTPTPSPNTNGFLITLESPDGEVVIPVTEEIDVGRNAAGKEYLGMFADVTRQHFTIAPRSNGITATLTDHGRWGTYVNGIRMLKETSIVVSNYSEIRLASRAVLLVRVREVNTDA